MDSSLSSHSIDFLVIGAQKAASSWMYYCLKDHPQLDLPERKREVEYIGGPMYNTSGKMGWYRGLFDEADPTAIWGDVSVEYLSSKDSPAEVYKHLPDCKLIVSLREPVSRLKSAYFWYLRKGLIGTENSFGEKLSEALKGGGDSGNVSGVAEMLERGLYADQLNRYLEYFSSDQILVLFYEDVRNDAMGVLRQVYEFLGVDTGYEPTTLGRRPKRNAYVKWLIDLERNNPGNKRVAQLVNVLNQLLARFVDERKSKASFLGELPVDALNDYYREPNQKLFDLLGTFKNGSKLQASMATAWKIEMNVAGK